MLDNRPGEAAAGFVFGLVAALPIAGCTSPKRVEPTTHCRSSHIVFNPVLSGVPVRDFTRNDWPATYTLAEPREETEYEERIIDIQGRRSGFADDFVYRRFESARSGQFRR